ncbi:MAG: acyl carrier protein [Candidatus Staskawiczbacteria bacterium]|nr:acyl carrier protein [Candidatus Staskawiczbacteria bacterium]
MAAIKERVVKIVAEQLGVEVNTVALENRFVEELGADSLDSSELVMALEEEFDIKIPDDVADKFKTVGQVVEYLEQHKGEIAD